MDYSYAILKRKTDTILEEYIAIYVPSTIGDESVDNTEITDIIKLAMSSQFGGVTVYKGAGGWLSPSGSYIEEDINIVKSFTRMLTPESINDVIDLANFVKHEMKQSSVAIEVNGKMIFV